MGKRHMYFAASIALFLAIGLTLKSANARLITTQIDPLESAASDLLTDLGRPYLGPCLAEISGRGIVPSLTFPACPRGRGPQPLSNLNPPAGLFVGYRPEAEGAPNNLPLIEAMIQASRSLSPRPMVNILLPRGVSLRELNLLLRGQESNSYNLIPTSQENFVGFAQDIFESLLPARSTDGIARLIQEVPNNDPGIANQVLQSCQQTSACEALEIGPRPTSPITRYNGTETLTMASGNEAGNIEAFPGGVIALGDSAFPDFRNRIAQRTGTSPLTLRTNFLNVGHVDEVVTVIPSNQRPAPCNYALLYPSPQLGMRLLASNPQTTFRAERSLSRDSDISSYRTPPNPRDCLASLRRRDDQGQRISTNDLTSCPDLQRAAESYEAILRENAENLARNIASRDLGCGLPPIEALPQIFLPERNQPPFGGVQDNAIPLNPNPVNSLILGHQAITPFQEFSPFEESVHSTYNRHGVTIRPVNDPVSHFLRGNIHCATNAIRVCAPPL